MQVVKPRKDEAKDIDRRLRGLVAAARRIEAEIAVGLYEMKRLKLYRYLSYPTMETYAETELGIPAGKAKELVEIAERLRKLPKLAAAFHAGELPWTKCRQVVRIATPETEAEWLERARTLPNRALERAVAAAKGERPMVRIVLELTETEAADLDDAVKRLREERREAMPLADAVAELCRRAMGPPVERPGYQVVIQECPTCGDASRDARGGPTPVAPEDVAAAKVDAEVVDLRQPGAAAKKSIKPRERRAVIARDRGRCVLCGSRAWLHIHHLERRHGGPEGLALLCNPCHKGLVHGGYVRIEGRAPNLTFARAGP